MDLSKVTTVSDEIIKVIDAVSEKTGMAIDWTSQNIVPYVTEVIHRFAMYKVSMNAVGAFIATLFFVATIFFLKYYNKNIYEDSDSEVDFFLHGLEVWLFLLHPL